MNEERPEYLNDAMEMAGAGYDHPSIEIHPPTTVIRRRGKRLVEESVPSQVHISTAFKSELADIDGQALKIWLFIALSLNRTTEEAFPGLATIAKGCNLSENTVVKYVRALEAQGLLTVSRENRKANIYAVPEYAFANLKTTSNIEVVAQTTSQEPQTTSNKKQTTSPRVRSNHINHIKPINNKKLSPEHKAALDLFKEAFGSLLGASECQRVCDLKDTYDGRLEQVIAWAAKKEIHLENRPSLVDAIETACKDWRDKPARRAYKPEIDPVDLAFAELAAERALHGNA